MLIHPMYHSVYASISSFTHQTMTAFLNENKKIIALAVLAFGCLAAALYFPQFSVKNTSY